MIIYVSKGDYRSYGFSPELWGGNTLEVEVPDNFSGGNKTYNPDTRGWVDDPVPERDYAAEANGQRRELLSLYSATTANWNTDLMLGDISDDDRAKLVAWRNWRKAVEAIDTSTASEETPVEFPAPPAS
ncbi:tail fiber assembly protein [Erwinia rhapontici]|uniref:tail fiber assembly protein n=1 Tax=Erwinia rhapontici TaxID=55212 RepID=UPI003D369B97